MVTKLFLIPNSLPSTFFFPKPSLPKSNLISLFSTTTTTTHSLPQTLIQSLHYGPSLLKGNQNQLHQQQEEANTIISDDQFTRIFHIAALRVPSKDCFALESRLRGHLLNWPRIRNIARVPGDEIDPEVISLLNKDDNEESLDSLNRRINGKAEGDGERLSPVLYREKLVKSFNARGFVRFRNLARISRPGKKKKKRERNCDEERKEIVAVEVLEEEEEREEMRGLLGEGFKGGRKWKGSTRLLLLDENFKDKDVEELPQAIQVYYHCLL